MPLYSRVYKDSLIHFTIFYIILTDFVWAWIVSVGLPTRYGLENPVIESQRGRDFPHPSLRSTQPPIQWVPGVKRPGGGADHPPHLAPRLKKV